VFLDVHQVMDSFDSDAWIDSFVECLIKIAKYMTGLADNQVVAGSYLASHCCSYLMHNFVCLVSKYQTVLTHIQMQMEGSKIEEKILCTIVI